MVVSCENFILATTVFQIHICKQSLQDLNGINYVHHYLLLTEFEVCSVSLRTRLFFLRAGQKSKGKRRGSVTYSTE